MSLDYRLRVSSPYFMYLYVQKYKSVASVSYPPPGWPWARVPCTLCTPYCYDTGSWWLLIERCRHVMVYKNRKSGCRRRRGVATAQDFRWLRPGPPCIKWKGSDRSQSLVVLVRCCLIPEIGITNIQTGSKYSRPAGNIDEKFQWMFQIFVEFLSRDYTIKLLGHHCKPEVKYCCFLNRK